MYTNGTHGPCGLLCECQSMFSSARKISLCGITKSIHIDQTALGSRLFLFGPLHLDLRMIWSLSPEPVGGISEKPHERRHGDAQLFTRMVGECNMRLAPINLHHDLRRT